MRYYYCGTPEKDCSGTWKKTSAGIGKDVTRVHTSSESAHRCMCSYLRKQGYGQMGTREMYKEGEEVLVLPKKTKMAALRMGKENRVMPKSGGFVA